MSTINHELLESRDFVDVASWEHIKETNSIFDSKPPTNNCVQVEELPATVKKLYDTSGNDSDTEQREQFSHLMLRNPDILLTDVFCMQKLYICI